jgi:hypothetical protein
MKNFIIKGNQGLPLWAFAYLHFGESPLMVMGFGPTGIKIILTVENPEHAQQSIDLFSASSA